MATITDLVSLSKHERELLDDKALDYAKVVVQSTEKLPTRDELRAYLRCSRHSAQRILREISDNNLVKLPLVAAQSTDQKVDVALERLRQKKEEKDRIIKNLSDRLERAEHEKEAILSIKSRTPQLVDIAPKVSSGSSESVCFMIASDWHSEERVLPGDVSYKNEFNIKICEERAIKFFQGGVRLFDILRRDTNIKTIVLGALGDFITNTLHEDAAESNGLLPADAIYRAQNLLVNGIRFILKNTPKDTDLLIVCHSGNHGRMTKKQRHTTETGNSLEQYMYYNLRDFFSLESRVKFQIAEGYHSYVRLFDGAYTVRMHHGHDMRYGGGVGGIYIPVNKAIAQWNKANKDVNLDVFGHFHSFISAPNFVANGSLIGYNAYAVAIKADYEPPQQALFLVNKKYNSKTVTTPIFLT